MQFKLKSEYIELDNLLKVLNLVSCGSEAKRLILDGQVTVDGRLEIRVRRKIRIGDKVAVAGQEISVE